MQFPSICSPSLFCPPHGPAGLWRRRLGPVAGIWASRTALYPAPTLPRAPPLVTFSSIPTNNHPAIPNTNKYNKVRAYTCALHVRSDGVLEVWLHVYFSVSVWSAAG